MWSAVALGWVHVDTDVIIFYIIYTYRDKASIVYTRTVSVYFYPTTILNVLQLVSVRLCKAQIPLEPVSP